MKISTSTSTRGFTLIEVMVVIAILGILFAIALPNFSAWRESHAIRTSTDTLLTHLKQARLLATSENRTVQITFPSTGSYTLDPYSSNRTFDLDEYHSDMLIHVAGDIGTPPADIVFQSIGTATAWNGVFTLNTHSKQLTMNTVGRSFEQ